jgi:hypothetical protein
MKTFNVCLSRGFELTFKKQLSVRNSLGNAIVRSSLAMSMLLLAGSTLFAQSTTPPDAPQPQQLHAKSEKALPDGPLPNYKPITGKERLKWFAISTAGPSSLLLSGPWSAGWGTLRNSPPEYGGSWEGFGSRYGMRLTGVSTGNAIEAGLGAIWKEDPRYFPSPNRAFGARVKYVIVTTFTAPGPNGRFRPAYARIAGNVGNNFLSNTWRVPSESSSGDAAIRCVWGALGRMGGDAFTEFWPDVKRIVFKK